MNEYTDTHASSGVDAYLPEIETWPNQYERDYEIEIIIPEINSVCPRTGLPDFGTITIRYIPDEKCLELKALKLYSVAYRDIGIFSENVVNKFLDDVVRACAPKRVEIEGKFNPRGGIFTNVVARFVKSTQ